MAGIVSNIIQNSIGGFVAGAVTTVGGYAGDAVGGVGNLIEGAGARVGNEGISGTFNSVGKGINSYGTSITNATAPNSGGSAVAVKKAAVKKDGTSTPKPSSQKALPSTKSMKAIEAPPAKKALPAVKSPYTPPAPVKKVEPKKNIVSSNTQKKVTPEARSLPAVKQPYQPPTKSEYKPAIPGYGFGDKAVSKAGSVVGSKPATPVYNSTVKKAPSVAGGYKPATGGYKPSIPGYGTKSQAGSVAGSVAGGGRSVAGSVAGGPKFF